MSLLARNVDVNELIKRIYNVQHPPIPLDLTHAIILITSCIRRYHQSVEM